MASMLSLLQSPIGIRSLYLHPCVSHLLHKFTLTFEQNKCLDSSCELLISTCRFQKCFIRNSREAESVGCIPVTELAQCGAAVRAALRRTFILLQNLCLSTKRTDWFPAFLAALIAAISAIIFIDGAAAIPSPVRELIYGDFLETAAGMRGNGYDLLVDLLRASTSGLNPLKLQCWNAHSDSITTEENNSRERQILLGIKPAAMDGMRELKAWQEKYQPVLNEGRNMFAANLYEVARIRPIASLFKIFAL